GAPPTLELARETATALFVAVVLTLAALVFALDVGDGFAESRAHDLLDDLAEPITVFALGEHTERNLEAALVGTAATIGFAVAVFAEHRREEGGRLDARAVGAKRAVDSIFDDAEDEHGVEVFTLKDE